MDSASGGASGGSSSQCVGLTGTERQNCLDRQGSSTSGAGGTSGSSSGAGSTGGSTSGSSTGGSAGGMSGGSSK